MSQACVLALILTLCLAVITPVLPATTEQWRSRTIYEVITDRFARTDCWGEPCDNLDRYCGGNFAGLQKMSSYIKEMGFDAVWWSPVTKQSPDAHGASKALLSVLQMAVAHGVV